MAVLSHWFKRRRATALGVLAFGASIGGTILPIVFRDVEVRIGYVARRPLLFMSLNILAPIFRFKWTMRAFALILLFFMTIGNLVCFIKRLPFCFDSHISPQQLVRRRLPPVKVKGGMFNLSVFKSVAFCMYTASSFVAFLGLFTGILVCCTLDHFAQPLK